MSSEGLFYSMLCIQVIYSPAPKGKKKIKMQCIQQILEIETHLELAKKIRCQ